MSASNKQIGQVSKSLVYKTLIPLVSLCLWASPTIAAESPQAVVQTGTDQVLNILKQYPQATRARRNQIQAVVNGYFDFEGMARLAVGPRWNSVSPEKRQEFTNEFSKLLFATYIGDIEKYAGQKITYNTKSVSPGYVVVEALINDRSGPVSLDYSLHLKDGDWRVYDAAVKGMSLAINYRDQFNSILANGSFDDLLMTLKQKIARICRTNRC